MDPVIANIVNHERHLARHHLDQQLGDWCEELGWKRTEWRTLRRQATGSAWRKAIRAIVDLFKAAGITPDDLRRMNGLPPLPPPRKPSPLGMHPPLQDRW